MKKNLLIFAFLSSISNYSFSEIRDGFYEDRDTSNNVGHYFSDGNYQKQKITYNFSSETHAFETLEKSSYKEDGYKIELSNGKVFVALDECRVVVDNITYYQQACMSSYANEYNAFRTDGTLIIPNLRVTNSKDIFYPSEKISVELKLIQNIPMRFSLNKVGDPEGNNTGGFYDVGVTESSKKLSINSVEFVNRNDHVLAYDVSFKEISSNPLTFEVIALTFQSAFDFWSGNDVSDHYQ